MPKINVYLPDELAAAVKEADLPVSAICQTALQKAVRDVTSAARDRLPSGGRADGGPGRALPAIHPACSPGGQGGRDDSEAAR